VEKEVLAIPSRAAGYGYGDTDNSFRVPDSSMCDLWFVLGLTEFCTETHGNHERSTAEKGGIRVSSTGAQVE
jgi:hypothetical protein